MTRRQDGLKPLASPATGGRRWLRWGGVLALLIWSGSQADTWHLKTGEVVVGKLLKEETSVLLVESPALGSIKVPREQIERWEHSGARKTPLPKPAPDEPPPATPAGGAPPSPAAPAQAAPPPVAAWPPTDGFDWIELKSGEWLRGRIKVIQDKKLEFDSDEMDEHTFDLEDIRRILSPSPNYLLFADKTTAVGAVDISPEKVVVKGEHEISFARDQLRGLSPGLPRERNYWSGKMSMGLAVRAGNTEQTDLSVSAKLQRRTPATHLSFDYLGNYAQLNGEPNANNHRVSLTYDIMLIDRFYLRPVFSQFFRDPFQNLAYQLTFGAGGGYHLLDTSRTEWEISGGPAYQLTRFVTVETGSELADATPAFVIGTLFDTELTKRIDLTFQYQTILSSPKSGTVTFHFVNTLEVELTKGLDLDVSFVWDRIQTPQAGADGQLPKQDDLRLSVGIGIDF